MLKDYFEKDKQALETDSVYIAVFDFFIPNWEVEMMVSIIDSCKEKKLTKYGMFRACERYLTKTKWYYDLDKESKYFVDNDFYLTVIRGIYHFYKRNDAYNKIDEFIRSK